MLNKSKKTTALATKDTTPKVVNTEAQSLFVRGIIGIVGLLVIGSISFLIFLAWYGTDDSLIKVAASPAMAFVAVVLFIALSKITK